VAVKKQTISNNFPDSEKRMSQINLGSCASIAVSYYKSEEFKSSEEAVFGQKHPFFKGLHEYETISLLGAMEVPHRSDVLTLLNDQRANLEAMGVKTLMFSNLVHEMSLQEFEEILEQTQKLGAVNLVVALKFKLVVESKRVFDADCDTLTEIPTNLVNAVIEGIQEKNPHMNTESLMKNVQARLECYYPFTDINCDYELASEEYPMGTLVDGLVLKGKKSF
jgi:hypothetical protein